MDLDHDATGQIHLFADSRYRLWVNGTIVGYGPARFHPDYPEYDSYDISDQLKAGPNVIQVEVWNVQEKNFQMQASRPGFIAWGNASQVDLSTSSNWRAIKSKARSVSAPRYSFAIPKTEILDQRILDAELAAVVDWPPAVAIDQSHWGELRPRSVPISRFQSRALNQCKVGVIAKPENRYRFHYDFQYSDKKNPMIAIATTLISLKDQDVELALFWGKNFLNGTELELIDDPILGNRQSVSVSLNRGANLLYSEIDACGKSWGHQLGVPAEANVTVQGLPGMEHAFMVSPIISSSEAPSLVAKVPATVEDVDVNFYTPFNEGLDTQFPTRVIAWDTPRDGLTDADITGLQLPMDATGKTVVIIDTKETFTGHPYIELHCEADTIFDISYDEVLRPDGLLNLYSHHLVNSTDRYFIEAGCRRIETLPERGGRYLQLNIESSAPVRLSQVGIRYSTRIPVMVSPLLAPDQFDQKVIDLCKRTLLAGYNECFTDSPWREQGMYLGDHYVQYLAMRSFCADESVIERSLRTFAYCQHPNGQIPAVCPGHYNRQHEDFSLIWILILGEPWKR